jgi:hypothetical protein
MLRLGLFFSWNPSVMNSSVETLIGPIFSVVERSVKLFQIVDFRLQIESQALGCHPGVGSGSTKSRLGPYGIGGIIGGRRTEAAG